MRYFAAVIALVLTSSARAELPVYVDTYVNGRLIKSVWHCPSDWKRPTCPERRKTKGAVR